MASTCISQEVKAERNTMNEITVDLEQVRQEFIANGMKMANHLNSSAAAAFEGAARNRAAYWFQVETPKPIAPMAVEAVFEFEPTWKFELVPTSVPVSTLEPNTLLPPPPRTDIDAVGGPVGSLINDAADPVKNKYNSSSTDSASPGAIYLDSKSGRRFVKIAEGFAGLRRYWLELK